MVLWSIFKEVRRGLRCIRGNRSISTLRKVSLVLGFSTLSHPEPGPSTEIGTVTEILPKEINKEWEWFRFNPSIKPHFIPDGNGAYELVIEV